MKNAQMITSGNKGFAPKARSTVTKYVLFAARNLSDHEALLRALERCGVQPLVVSTASEARGILARNIVSLVFCEEALADGSYHEILRQVGGITSRVPVVIFSELADWDRYLEAMRSGAFDYLRYPCPPTEIKSAVDRALTMPPLFAKN